MIIALGHKARQGKDTAGEAIVDYYNMRRDVASTHLIKTRKFDTQYPPAKIFKFADELYRICREEYGMKEKDGPLLQKVGNSRREEYGLVYWINKLASKVLSFNGIAVITDLRYRNEAAWVKSINGHTINVRRILDDGTFFTTTDRDPSHPSEVELDGYNYDHYILSKNAAETCEIAITIAEFIRSLECQ